MKLVNELARVCEYEGSAALDKVVPKQVSDHLGDHYRFAKSSRQHELTPARVNQSLP
jgi:hypothetical protein